MSYLDTFNLITFYLSEPNPCIYPTAVNCGDNGKCEADGDSHKCACKNGYTGKYCDTSKKSV